ncbi:MAG: MCE family protein [Kiritimatiellae bacterium]|nr:MCE family protein [Kiritimatiellia bacterium]
MACDNKTNYSRIGFTIIAGTVAIAAALVYLGGAGGKKAALMAETYSDTPVSGLSVGSAVNFRGVQVGTVKEITFVGRAYDVPDDADGRKILIRFALDEMKVRARSDYSGEDSLRRFVSQGLRATVSSSGITGISRIELNYPKVPSAPEKISWTPEMVCIPPEPSILESFSESASHVMAQLNTMDFKSAWSNVNLLVENIAHIAEDAAVIVESQKATLGEISTDASAAISELRTLAGELKENPSLLLRPRDPEPLPETAQ